MHLFRSFYSSPHPAASAFRVEMALTLPVLVSSVASGYPFRGFHSNPHHAVNLFRGFNSSLHHAVHLFPEVLYMYIHVECRGFESHPRQLIFSRKSDCLGCAVLLCLVCLFHLACFFLSSFSSLIINMYL